MAGCWKKGKRSKPEADERERNSGRREDYLELIGCNAVVKSVIG